MTSLWKTEVLGVGILQLGHPFLSWTTCIGNAKAAWPLEWRILVGSWKTNLGEQASIHPKSVIHMALGPAWYHLGSGLAPTFPCQLCSSWVWNWLSAVFLSWRTSQEHDAWSAARLLEKHALKAHFLQAAWFLWCEPPQWLCPWVTHSQANHPHRPLHGNEILFAIRWLEEGMLEWKVGAAGDVLAAHFLHPHPSLHLAFAGLRRPWLWLLKEKPNSQGLQNQGSRRVFCPRHSATPGVP